MALDPPAGMLGIKRAAAAADGDRSVRARLAILALAGLLAATVLFSLASGASDASAVAVVRDWLFPSFSTGDALSIRDRVIVYDIRLPRVIMGVLIGAALAVSGAVLQGLFRNPLADPGLVGVSAGSSLGAVAVIVLGATVLGPLTALLGIFTLPLAAFAGGLATTLVLYQISTRQGRTFVATMLLGGIALGALAMAFTGMLIFMANDRQLRDLTFWSLGSLAGFVGQTAQGDVDNLSGAVLQKGSFAEVAVNLTALFGEKGCSGTYGVLNIRSNSSAGNDNSSMKDWIAPVALNVPSTCSTLKIVKVDALDHAKCSQGRSSRSPRTRPRARAARPE